MKPDSFCQSSIGRTTNTSNMSQKDVADAWDAVYQPDTAV